MRKTEMAGANLFVISANQGAGKSAVGDALAKRFPVAAHIDGDYVQRFVVSGKRWPESLDDIDPSTGQWWAKPGVSCASGCEMAA
jgi:hypothetical protein